MVCDFVEISARVARKNDIEVADMNSRSFFIVERINKYFDMVRGILI